MGAAVELLWGRFKAGLERPVEGDSAEVEGHARDSVKGAVRGGLATTYALRLQGSGRVMGYLLPLYLNAWQAVQA